MSAPSFKQLEAFWWAASCASFAVAAERLYLSVSSLSKRISELESTLGKPLFDRSGQRAVLTEDGRWLLPAAAKMLESMAELQAGFGGRGALSGHCRFGVGELSALSWLPEFMAHASRQHPELLLEPYVDVGAVLEARLADGELDFAVIAGRSSRNVISAHPVGSARFNWVGSSALPGGKPHLDAESLATLTVVTLSSGAGTTRILDDWLLAASAHPARRIECNNWIAVAGMLRKGLGVGFLPEGWIDSPHDPLYILETLIPLPPLQYSFQWKRGDSRQLIPAMRELVSAKMDFSVLPGGR